MASRSIDFPASERGRDDAGRLSRLFARLGRARGRQEDQVVLLPYRREPKRWQHRLVKTTILALIVLWGLMYGFLLAIFPYWFYLFLAFPLIALGLMVIWALPERDWAPVKAIEWLYWAFLVSLLAWPNYLAIALPGLPWITIQRLFLGPLTLLLLIALSTKAELRASIRDALADSPTLTTMMIVFVVVQVITLFFSGHTGVSINRFVSNQLAWTAVFFASVWLFQKEGRIDKWYNLVIGLAVFACAVALIELRLQKVPWADHIPSFLAVADERVQMVLYGDRARSWTNKYRVAATFVHPLNLAEFLGLSTALFVHRLMTVAKTSHRVLLAAALPVLLFVIIATDSRLGIIAFFGSIIGYGFLWGWRRWLTQRGDLIAPALIIAYPAGLAAFFTLSIVWNRLSAMMWGTGNGAAISSTEARQEQWALFWPKFEAWPFGYGTGQSGEALQWFSPGGDLSVDSYLITVALDWGAIGFIAFFGMFFVGTFVATRWSIRVDTEEGPQFMPLAVMLPIFVLIKTVLSQEDEHAFAFMLLGMLVALVHLRKRSDRRAPVATILPPVGRRHGPIGRISRYA